MNGAMENQNDLRQPVFTNKFRAGKKRTYFFDIRKTKGEDYFLTVTESKKRFNEDGYDRHKIVVYKEDFNKFIEMLTQTIDHVKTELLPHFNFDEYRREDDSYESNDNSQRDKEDMDWN